MAVQKSKLSGDQVRALRSRIRSAVEVEFAGCSKAQLDGITNDRIARALAKASAKRPPGPKRKKRRNAKAKTSSPAAKTTPNFYVSQEWRQIRYLALKNTGGRCQCCGASASDGITLHVDHIQPLARGGAPLDLGNLQVLCADCNVGKGSWDDTDWRNHWDSI